MSYLSKAVEKLKEIEASEQKNLETVSERLAQCIRNGGILHTFGCGHSSLLAQDAYYRAGGLVPVRPIAIEPLMLHEGARRSSDLERTPGFVDSYIEEEPVEAGDMVLVISVSGRNPAPIDVARYYKAKGVQVIALTALAYSESVASRHPSGERLEDVADFVLDLHIPVGDAVMDLEGLDQSFSPLSSVAGTALLHDMFSRTVERLHEDGYEVPIFKSGNIDGSDEHNQRMMERFKRIGF
ncbi:sugar isomerase domain-containing protein [Halobacillus salinus]|uniref:Sugar isomerase domain-containing protein n=1 Tax=Halobacillus salinus TaxID=192814 RepID=A0A4Z0H1J7_9BACI|nr:SIS domain-containing protein [Halobacillus salinus]TGB03764.1 sugar isomerase domain-containing protein [Halobacillus salinus]